MHNILRARNAASDMLAARVHATQQRKDVCCAERPRVRRGMSVTTLKCEGTHNHDMLTTADDRYSAASSCMCLVTADHECWQHASVTISEQNAEHDTSGITKTASQCIGYRKLVAAT